MDLESLIKHLADPRRVNRLKAVRTLGSLGDLQAVKPLIVCLQDDDGFVFQAAVAALGTLGGRGVGHSTF